MVVGPDDIRPRPMRVCGITKRACSSLTNGTCGFRPGAQDAARRGRRPTLGTHPTGVRAVGQAFGRDERVDPVNCKTCRLTQNPSIGGHRALTDTVRLSHGEDGWVADISEGTHHKVVDGYDVWAQTLDDMPLLQGRLFQHIPYHWQAARVDQQHPEMFSWLGMLDLNVDVIVGLMVLISIINMISARH